MSEAWRDLDQRINRIEDKNMRMLLQGTKSLLVQGDLALSKATDRLEALEERVRVLDKLLSPDYLEALVAAQNAIEKYRDSVKEYLQTIHSLEPIFHAKQYRMLLVLAERLSKLKPGETLTVNITTKTGEVPEEWKTA